MTDDVDASLRALKAQLPTARFNLSEPDKDELIRAIGGPRTVENIRKAMSKLPHERIPWLFSSLDSQLVIDVMANDMEAAITRAKAGQNREHS
ncbi:MAG: hypothetical protein M3Q07_01800 [Pseudobdellovibrionaceae bacterium]|nr:hypothetical protein [Pseudobdellovibrionaceae bacterium]